MIGQAAGLRLRPVRALQMGLATLGASAAALAIGVVALKLDTLQAAMAAVATLALVAAGFRAPRRTLVLLVGWLVLMGTLRRILQSLAPATAGDPLLLVAPMVLGLLALAAIRRGALDDRTPLATAVIVLSVLTLAGAVNPLQGSVFAGLAGLLFFFVPMLGFWVGRGLCDDGTFRRLMLLIAALAPLTALYGLSQTFSGFRSWDQVWIESVRRQYLALDVAGNVRAFGSFSAASEYAAFLAVGVVIWLAFGLRGVRRILTMLAVWILLIALVFESGRGVIVTLLVALALMLAAQRGLPMRGALVGAVALLLVIPVLISALAPDNFEQAQGSALLLQHQVRGLADPLSSTLPLHIDELTQGLLSSVSHPLGIGIGAVSIAVAKFGGVAQNTEVDPSNAAVALGIPGLLAYLSVLVLGMWSAYRVALARRDALALVALGIPVVLLLQWLNGGQYAVAFLPWLALGWIDRHEHRRQPVSPDRVIVDTGGRPAERLPALPAGTALLEGPPTDGDPASVASPRM
jgi:hypothetical protein